MFWYITMIKKNKTNFPAINKAKGDFTKQPLNMSFDKDIWHGWLTNHHLQSVDRTTGRTMPTVVRFIVCSRGSSNYRPSKLVVVWLQAVGRVIVHQILAAWWFFSTYVSLGIGSSKRTLTVPSLVVHWCITYRYFKKLSGPL